MTVFMAHSFECECGKYHHVVSGELPHATLTALRSAMEQAGVELSVITGDNTNVTCSSCGVMHNMPPLEMLDVERSTLGKLLQEIEREVDEQE